MTDPPTLQPAEGGHRALTAHGAPDITRFLLRTAELLHAYGTPAHRLERVIVKLAAGAGQQVQVFSSPTSIFLGFDGAQTGTGVRLLRVQPGGVDLGRLVVMDEILEEVEEQNLSHAAALERMEAMHAAPTRGGGITSVGTVAANRSTMTENAFMPTSAPLRSSVSQFLSSRCLPTHVPCVLASVTYTRPSFVTRNRAWYLETSKL